MNDPYVKLAQKHGYRARAAFKLIEIDEQDKLIKPGMTIVDLGSTPGAWSQAIRERLRIKTQSEDGKATVVNGRIIALDILPMEPIADVEFMLGDFREDAVMQLLETSLQGQKVDLVLSDMAPNLSGVQIADAARMTHLVELAMEFSEKHLKPEGALLVKCFHGTGYSQLVELFKRKFKQVAPRKPKASRPESAEIFILGRRLKA